MSETKALDAMPEVRRSILVALKRRGPQGIAELAGLVGISYEGVRQQLGQLDLDGWITRRVEREATGPGRPRSVYRLTSAGEHLFPKEYDDLAVALIDAASDRLGPDSMRELLGEIARKKIEHWEPILAGKSFEQRLEALRGIYLADDPFCAVEHEEGQAPRLIEMNCPFLEVARRRPALCSVTVSVLRHLLGREVIRTERFQDGAGRCVFKVLDTPVTRTGGSSFVWEAS